jgi:hypothetical protein
MWKGRLSPTLYAATGTLALSWLLCAACAPSLPRSDAASVGLAWHECPVPTTASGPEWGQACRQGPGSGSDAVIARYGERIDEKGDFRLQIGVTEYRTASTEHQGAPGADHEYTLYEDGRPIASLSGRVTGQVPRVGLMDLGGRAAWEFDDGEVATVIYDGRDLRKELGLDRVRAPHLLDGKLIFLGEKAHRSFVVFDGERVGPDFDRVYVYHCCEAAMTAGVRKGEASYGFLADRNGQSVGVVISSANAGVATPVSP